jgi:hypothetical protein
VIRVLAGVVLFAHGAIHVLYLVRNPDDPNYPFNIESSWLVPGSARRPVAIALIIATVAAFALLALAVWGVPGLADGWPVITIVASVISLVLLIAFWHRWLFIGVAIDLVLIAIAVIRPDWTDQIGG